MDLQEFLDKAYAGWAKTTGAEDRFWGVEDAGATAPEADRFLLYAMGQDETKVFIGSFRSEVDADFAATLHGALPDLVRRTSEAVDEAERLSLDRDQQEGRIADLELEILGLKQALDAR